MKGLIKKKNTQVNVKERMRINNMDNHPMQCDLIGINGKIGFSRTRNMKHLSIVSDIFYINKQ